MELCSAVRSRGAKFGVVPCARPLSCRSVPLQFRLQAFPPAHRLPDVHSLALLSTLEVAFCVSDAATFSHGWCNAHRPVRLANVVSARSVRHMNGLGGRAMHWTKVRCAVVYWHKSTVHAKITPGSRAVRVSEVTSSVSLMEMTDAIVVPPARCLCIRRSHDVRPSRWVK